MVGVPSSCLPRANNSRSGRLLGREGSGKVCLHELTSCSARAGEPPNGRLHAFELI